MHELSPEHTTVGLQQCVDNSNGSEGYYEDVARIRQKAREENLPSDVIKLTDKLTQLPLGGWQPVPSRLCRADHNIRNFILDNGMLKSVDWEYSGWGDPAEDFAEMIAHATYMEVPPERWDSVIEDYANRSMIEHVRERIQICLAIKLVGWAVRIARAFVSTKPERSRLASLNGEWRVDTKKKYEYYLERTQTHLSSFAIA